MTFLRREKVVRILCAECGLSSLHFLFVFFCNLEQFLGVLRIVKHMNPLVTVWAKRNSIVKSRGSAVAKPDYVMSF